jgi:broad specificity phosphatase PhoE
MYPVILVRHGQAEHNVSDLMGGWSQTSLTEPGLVQAHAAARRLSEELDGSSVRLISSDLRRARQTAEIIGEALGVEPEYVAGVRELNNGVAAGKTKQESREFFVEPHEPLLDWQPYPGAETWRRMYARVSEAMDDLMEAHDAPLVIVTHGGTIVGIVSWWLQLSPEQMRWVSFHCEPASITVLDLTELGEHRLERLNDTQHLIAVGCYNPLSV